MQEEFDFEAPADENGVPDDGPIPVANDAEINGRLTMRDAILVRKRSGVKAQKPRSANFQNLLHVSVSGVDVAVKRGWNAVRAQVRKSRKFTFVNTHLEAFDDSSQVPSIRAQQAGELVAPGGPAAGKRRVVLLGDLNSDDDTVASGDQQAYRALLAAGFSSRSTANPLSCCLDDPLLGLGGTGDRSQFDHQVDHVMTNQRPKKVKLLRSSVTGLDPVNGLWPSDHAGVFSKLRIR